MSKVELCLSIFDRKEYGKMVGMYFGSKRAVIINDYDLINEAFTRDEFVGRPSFMAGADKIQGLPES